MAEPMPTWMQNMIGGDKNYDKNPELFKLVPKEKYQGDIDYLKKYYNSAATRKKLKNYYLEHSSFPKEKIDQKVDEALKDAISKLDTRKVYSVDESKLEEIEKINPTLSALLKRGNTGLSEGENIFVKSDLGALQHELGHDAMSLGKGFYKEWPTINPNIGTVVGEKIKTQYSPLPVDSTDKSWMYDFIKAGDPKSSSSELRAIFNDLRTRHRIDPDKPVNLKDYPGLKNDYIWDALKKVYKEEDLQQMFNDDKKGIVMNTKGKGVEDFSNYVKKKNEKNV
jgi:hypothetical protein